MGGKVRMKVLVTGSAGMLAKDLIPCLSKRGHEVIAPPEDKACEGIHHYGHGVQRNQRVVHAGIDKLAFARLLPHVLRDMEKPEYWIKKIKNPGRILLTPEEIQRMNEENLKKEELFLCSVKDLKEEWTKEEILSLPRKKVYQSGKKNFPIHSVPFKSYLIP
jgi:hypothetical protein